MAINKEIRKIDNGLGAITFQIGILGRNHSSISIRIISYNSWCSELDKQALIMFYYNHPGIPP